MDLWFQWIVLETDRNKILLLNFFRHSISFFRFLPALNIFLPIFPRWNFPLNNQILTITGLTCLLTSLCWILNVSLLLLIFHCNVIVFVCVFFLSCKVSLITFLLKSAIQINFMMMMIKAQTWNKLTSWCLWKL